MGYFFERVGRALSFVWAATAMAFRDKDLFIPSILSFFANAAYIIVLVAVLYSTNSLWLVGVSKSEIDDVKQMAVGDRKSIIDSVDQTTRNIQEQARAQELAEETTAGAPGSESVEAVAAREAAPREPADESPIRDKRTRSIVQFLFGGLCIFGALLITYFFMAMTISLVHAHLKGEDAQIAKAFSVVVKRAGSIALLALISTGVQLLAALARDKEGHETFLSGLIDKALQMAVLLTLPAIVIEDFSIWRGLKRAKEIVSRNLIVVGTGEIAVGLVGGLITFLGLAAGVVAGFFLYRAMPAPIYFPIGVGGMVAVLAMAFAAYVRVAYYTCLYVNAVESARIGRRAPLPGPLAAALE